MKNSSGFLIFPSKEKLGVFFLWLLGISSVLSFFYLYGPTPFSLINKQQVNQRKDGFNPDYKSCDLFNGRWIPDMNGSLYSNGSCLTLPDSKNCKKHGRRDTDYLNWRWKPHGCELNKFDAKMFLQIVRGKTLAFIGDSVARNQMESLLCLLSQEETPVDIYKDSENRFRTWFFPSHNFTMKVLWTKFFITAEELLMNGTASGAYDLQLDKIENNWAEKLPGTNYAIISGVHWFFRTLYLYEHEKLRGCYYCQMYNKTITNLQVDVPLRKAYRTTLKYIDRCEECGNMLTVLRTFAPAHFEYGGWNTGGRCNRTSPYYENQINLETQDWEMRNVQVQELARIKNKGENKGRRFEILDVTKAMLMRPDGHPDQHWPNSWSPGYSDCVHWCLPGPIDAWNDLLMAILKKDASSHNN